MTVVDHAGADDPARRTEVARQLMSVLLKALALGTAGALAEPCTI